MRTPRRCLRIAALILLAASSVRAEEKPFSLKDGDRVVFYGDSITDQRLYTTFTESYVVTRFPAWNVAFTHSGWGGDRVTGGGGGPIDVRLGRDVVPYKPTVVTVMLGMNDASYRLFDEKIFGTYKDGYQHLVSALKKDLPGVRLTLIGPSPFDDVTRPPMFEGGYNAVLVRYSQFVKELAQKEGGEFADLNTSVVEATRRANETDHNLAVQLNPDRVHPGPSGQLLMAGALLKAWNAPAVVSAVELAGDQGKAVKAENTKVTDLKVSDGTFSWTQEDAALPFPLNLGDAATALALKSSDFLKDLDRQTLTVSNPAASEYRLKIDGNEVGTFTRDQLAAGVNLADIETPMLRQAREVHGRTLKHNEIHFTRWRMIQVPMHDADKEKLAKVMEALDSIEGDVVKQQHQAAQPKPHRFELSPKS